MNLKELEQLLRAFKQGELEETEAGRQIASRHHEHVLLVRADGDVGALLDDALLDDAPGLDQTDPEHLRARRGDRPHDGGHLPGATTRRSRRLTVLCHRLTSKENPIGERAFPPPRSRERLPFRVAHGKPAGPRPRASKFERKLPGSGSSWLLGRAA